MKKAVPNFVIFFLSILYFEFFFKIFTHQNLWEMHCILILLYDCIVAGVLSLLSSLGKPKVNKVIFYLFLLVLTIWSCAEVVFKNSFQVYFSLATTFFADQAISFFDKVLEILMVNALSIGILLIPIILAFIFSKHISFQKTNFRKVGVSFLGMIVSYLCFYGFLIDAKEEDNSPYELYFHLENNALNKETFGMYPATLIEIRKMIFPTSQKLFEPVVEEPTPEEPEEEEKPKTYEQNILEIPFASLAENESDTTLKEMHEYFSKDIGTTQNEYTGMFEGKNLILFMAESFNSIAVDEELTPTLYKLTHEGFVFENFYSPVILSTIGGEFQELTGLYPNLSMLSNVWRTGRNAYPFGYGKMFEDAGYLVQAYHDHKYNFQNRDTYLRSLGFKNYTACFNGLESRINCNQWPESDLEMISATTEDYLTSDKPFFTYYVTVSGHMSYNFSSNAMSRKNQSLVNDLPYSTDIKAYLASNIELDRALEKLIEDLEVNGKLEDTVIALVADHYPYDISLEHINEIAGNRDSTVEINRSHFILWNSEMEETKITKVGGNMDVLPTLLNLFGLDYDSRLIMGKDLLSNSYGLVIFADSSWISDMGRYYASSKKFVANEGVVVPEDYVKNINQVVSNRIRLSKLIIEKDYYRKVLGE